jgi:hypothetical protein
MEGGNGAHNQRGQSEIAVLTTKGECESKDGMSAPGGPSYSANSTSAKPVNGTGGIIRRLLVLQSHQTAAEMLCNFDHNRSHDRSSSNADVIPILFRRTEKHSSKSYRRDSGAQFTSGQRNGNLSKVSSLLSRTQSKHREKREQEKHNVKGVVEGHLVRTRTPASELPTVEPATGDKYVSIQIDE